MKVEKLTLKNFEKITPEKPMIIRVNEESDNFFFNISLTPHTYLYCIDMFYDQDCKEECNRIFTKVEIQKLALILAQIYKYIRVVKKKNGR